MDEKLKEDLDRVFQLANDVETGTVQRELHALHDRLHSQENVRKKTVEEKKSDPMFQTLKGSLESLGLSDADALRLYDELKRMEK